MKKYFLFCLLVLSLSGFAQNSINNYKYVIVPEKFSFLKQNDQYMLNSAVKALLEQKGFTAYFNNAELPAELSNNKCAALDVDLIPKNKLFSTNLTLVLKDCRGNVVLKSKQGISREKDFDTAYNAALIDAFTSLNDTPYAYNPTSAVKTPESSAKGQQTALPLAPAASAPAVAAADAAIASSQPVIESKALTLYAQSTAFGYQLVDTAPKIILTLYRTTAANYFIANNGSDNGIVFKTNEDWTFEYYKNGKLVTEKLAIKF